MSILRKVNTRNEEKMFDSLNQVVMTGLALLKSEASDEQYRLWEDYSKEMIRLATSSTKSNLYANYLNLLLKIHAQDLTPELRIRKCVRFLLLIMKIL